jgi:hypothetical protein
MYNESFVQNYTCPISNVLNTKQNMKLEDVAIKFRLLNIQISH